MNFIGNFKSKIFWVEVLKLAVIFFILFMGFSLLFSQFSNVMSGNFGQIYEEEWANGKWKNDVLLKGTITVVYSIYMVSRRRRSNSKLEN